MSEKVDHHFVPQYHLRLFMNGCSYIHLAARDGSRVVYHASIRRQCARSRLYGNIEVENSLAQLESHYAKVYRAIMDVAWNGRMAPLSHEEISLLREALLVQHMRTPRTALVLTSATDQMIFHVYLEYLRALPITPKTQAIIEAIQSGKATIRNSHLANLMKALSVASKGTTLISDLSLKILRNHASVPFILGDAPCVFSNHYMRSIHDLGVLGLKTPGLMIAMPIDYRTQVLLYDSDVYYVGNYSGNTIDIFSVEDVSLLNALQIHASEENIYFSELHDETYIRRLLDAHHNILEEPDSRLIVHSPGTLLIGGVLAEDDILDVFEPQLPITLDLSFISTAPLRQDEWPNRPRNPDLARQFHQAVGRPNGKPVGTDVLVKYMESHLCI